MESLDIGMSDNQVTGLDKEAKAFLLSAAKWARFLAIVGLVFVGLIVVLAFSAGAIFSKLGEVNPAFGMVGNMGFAFTFIYLGLAVLMFFPAWYLFQFAKKAIADITLDNGNFRESFQNLKSCFKFYGIFTLIFLSFYAVIIFIFLIALMFK